MSKFECEVLIVGAGPAGLAAACCAAETGKRVSVTDDNPDLGGQIWRVAQKSKTSKEAAGWFERIRNSKIEFINGARVFQQSSDQTLLAETVQGLAELSYQKLILSTGARERFLPFPGWTLPNVFGAGGLQALVKSGLSIEGKRAVIAGSGPLLLAVAGYLRERGANVMLIAEQAATRSVAAFGLGLAVQMKKATQAMSLNRRLRGVPYLTGCWPVRAYGNDKLAGVTLRRGNKTWNVECDFLGCGFHLVPGIELAQLVGCDTESGAVVVDEFQSTSVNNVYAAGEVTGIGGLDLSLVEGEIAGLASTGRCDDARKLFGARKRQQKFSDALNRAFALRDELKTLVDPDTIVCRCEDVRFGRLQQHDSWRSAKLQTRCGMGPCQGRICGTAVEFLLGWRATSVRPPVFPARVESLVSQPGESSVMRSVSSCVC